MALNAYFYTEQVAGKLTNGWTYIDTNIDEDMDILSVMIPPGNTHSMFVCPTENRFYAQSEAATEPVTDDLLDQTAWSGPEASYYIASAGYFISFTTDTGVFGSDQVLDNESKWLFAYNARYTANTPGYSPFIRFEVYKRDGSNNDTALFNVKGSLPPFKFGNGIGVSVEPSGSPETTDRLRIRVYGGEIVPS